MEKNSVHIWPLFLPDYLSEVDALSRILTADEKDRASRFKFALHQQRFIITRAFLRKILSSYIDIPPQDIQIGYSEHGKPFLQNNPLNLHFNVSHSQDWAVFAVTTEHEIGVDIERIAENYNTKITSRFFSPEEQACLNALTGLEQVKMFYRIWARKEAVIKALGKNIYSLLAHFSVPFVSEKENIVLTINQEKSLWHVEDFFVDENYQAAFAIQHPIEKIIFKNNLSC